MPFHVSPVEIILILVIIFIVFGAGKLPQIFELAGRGLRVFRGGKKDSKDELTPKKKKVIRKLED